MIQPTDKVPSLHSWEHRYSDKDLSREESFERRNVSLRRQSEILVKQTEELVSSVLKEFLGEKPVVEHFKMVTMVYTNDSFIDYHLMYLGWELGTVTHRREYTPFNGLEYRVIFTPSQYFKH
jgi:hypothetical protein